jgi:hypothetical protein
MTNKILANMTQHLTLLKFVSIFSLWLIPAVLGAREPQIQVQQILQTTQSWDSVSYQTYPTGQPQLTVLRIRFRPTLLCITGQFAHFRVVTPNRFHKVEQES